ncbi:Cysteine proteinase inhibitor 5 [Striga hermonthica]|uniref:Cysteine proteinase inhibitor 5 n=1 Tax=Striga hermonthica TaxID=68872 RepID=A0A9N7NTK2_STRHE|nr:Cysteine proteinase inhibitor 5 [Striga hermonthica]
MISKSLWLFILVILPFFASIDLVQVSAKDSWCPITQPRSHEMVEYGKFAVKEMNELGGTHMAFESVLQGATLKEGEKVYIRFELSVKDGYDRSRYMVNMYEVPTIQFKKVTNIRKLP